MSPDYRELHGLSVRLLDYLRLCNEKNIAPLKHDINLFANELMQIDRRANRVSRSKA